MCTKMHTLYLSKKLYAKVFIKCLDYIIQILNCLVTRAQPLNWTTAPVVALALQLCNFFPFDRRTTFSLVPFQSGLFAMVVLATYTYFAVVSYCLLLFCFNISAAILVFYYLLLLLILLSGTVYESYLLLPVLLIKCTILFFMYYFNNIFALSAQK